MKKYIVLMGALLILMTGCGKENLDNIKDNFVKTQEKKEVYLIKANMSIISNEDTFTYEVSAARNKDEYRVDLVNQINNHEQTILKSTEGVYVVTPSLKKSFKFQSEWPDNGSQAYLIDSLVRDIKSDPESLVERIDDGYIINAKVNYPNNANLTCERIYLNNKLEVEKIEVLDSTEKVKITVTIKTIDYRPTFDDDYFKLETLIDDECCEDDETVSKTIEDIIYPLYLPNNTYLSSKDSINTDNGNRVILTFTGDSPFTLIEEISSPRKEFEIIPVFGEPFMLSDTLGALSANSLFWTSNNIDFYLSSDKLSGTELLTIAESVSAGTLSVYSPK